MTGNNHNLDLVNINAHSQDIEWKQNSAQNADIKGHNSGTIVGKMMSNDPNLDLVNINTYTKFGQILSNSSQDIERKQNYDRRKGGIQYLQGTTDFYCIIIITDHNSEEICLK